MPDSLPSHRDHRQPSELEPHRPVTVSELRTIDPERFFDAIERVYPSIAADLEPVLYPDGPWLVRHQPARRLP